MSGIQEPIVGKKQARPASVDSSGGNAGGEEG
jgi:hypothetical protein